MANTTKSSAKQVDRDASAIWWDFSVGHWVIDYLDDQGQVAQAAVDEGWRQHTTADTDDGNVRILLGRAAHLLSAHGTRGQVDIYHPGTDHLLASALHSLGSVVTFEVYALSARRTWRRIGAV